MRSSAERTLRLWGSLAVVTSFCVQHYTLAHPFLLADNRWLLLGVLLIGNIGIKPLPEAEVDLLQG